jgi:hypothetical protein
MTTYRVSVFKTPSNNISHEAEVLRRQFEVEAQSEIEALKAAKAQYCSLMKISDCSFYTDAFKIDRISWDLSSSSQNHGSKVASPFSSLSVGDDTEERSVSPDLRQRILAILATGQDMTVATLREDGYPQATTVSYANDGLAIYFGCSAASQKARNIARDSRVSLTITLPYAHWAEIQGLSIGGRANQLTDPQDLELAGQLLLQKFPEGVAEYGSGMLDSIAFIRVTPEIISVLDYRKGFGHTDLVTHPTLTSDAEL